MKRIDGRLVIGVMVLVGVAFVLLNVFLSRSPKGERVLSSPSSEAVPPGRSYSVRLLSDCAAAVDFDGSYWARSGSATLSSPLEPATIRLVSGDRAVLRLRSGQRVGLSRIGTVIRLSPCPSAAP